MTAATPNPMIDTTCTYAQITAALEAENAAAYDQFRSSSEAQSWLNQFLSEQPGSQQRVRMWQQAEGVPEVQANLAAIEQAASTCSEY